MNANVATSRQALKVLIVEDTRTITNLLQVYLMGWGLEFFDAPNGVEGLSKARDLKPDLIISDVQMPLMDGFALCAAVRADTQLHNIPFMMLTSLKDDASRQKGKLVGANAFLNKPVSVDDLRSKVSDMLKLPAKTR
ncbi:response regulator [Myxococcus sp. CA051A]|uniref:Response regulator n=1 Tax=Myxococcus llanfairpwllgwyngyllgogerychwyrndrobwllllantysiliogogogochensis TaxID=2590453 RepID=A0A540WX08_9BACT|nr:MULTISPECIES: response regulator [Myxococcus]NTX04020.1 response regulator [Myxococcus sp. CA040A]NTX13368.1 response regulator [Myxococcus sp. CA056]NTX35772.1 response regulator [Myxococcus sp. CA033]NTX56525.1 response regulator [Myxococcus sp. CA039A]NTX61827.1 response regulator [Myxococcus sp. CA051A]